jgi:hypothetical protein
MLEANGIKNMTILFFRRNLANGRPFFNLDVTGLGHFFIYIFRKMAKFRDQNKTATTVIGYCIRHETDKQPVVE